jgi:uncharacterized membrane protein
VAYDLVADPNHLHRGGWAYAGGGAYYGVPLQNFVAWYVLGLVSFLWLGTVGRRIASHPAAPSDVPIALLCVVAYEGVLIHESLFALLIAGHRGAGALGLAVATGVVVLWRRRGARTAAFRPSSSPRGGRHQPRSGSSRG